jgi:hypothetical protein
VFDGFEARPTPSASPTVTYDGRPTVQTELLRVDIELPDDFERTKRAAESLSALARAEANSTLAHLRVLGRSPHVRPITDTTCSRFRFLHDDETGFEPARSLVTQARVYGHPTDVLVVPPALWDAARTVPDNYQTSPWDALVLDAIALLPDIGPAMVLAYAALEARITSALDVLASKAGVDAAVWDWLNDRDDYSKQPSIRERFDVMLKWLGGKSLKEEPRLWDGFLRLRDARNSFAHTGVALIGKKRKGSVSREAALEMVAMADQIIDWVDHLLPESHRRPSLTTPAASVAISKRTTGKLAVSVQIQGLGFDPSTTPQRVSGEMPGE